MFYFWLNSQGILGYILNAWMNSSATPGICSDPSKGIWVTVGDFDKAKQGIHDI